MFWNHFAASMSDLGLRRQPILILLTLRPSGLMALDQGRGISLGQVDAVSSLHCCSMQLPQGCGDQINFGHFPSVWEVSMQTIHSNLFFSTLQRLLPSGCADPLTGIHLVKL